MCRTFDGRIVGEVTQLSTSHQLVCAWASESASICDIILQTKSRSSILLTGRKDLKPQIKLVPTPYAFHECLCPESNQVSSNCRFSLLTTTLHEVKYGIWCIFPHGCIWLTSFNTKSTKFFPNETTSSQDEFWVYVTTSVARYRTSFDEFLLSNSLAHCQHDVKIQRNLVTQSEINYNTMCNTEWTQ